MKAVFASLLLLLAVNSYAATTDTRTEDEKITDYLNDGEPVFLDESNPLATKGRKWKGGDRAIAKLQWYHTRINQIIEYSGGDYVPQAKALCRAALYFVVTGREYPVYWVGSMKYGLTSKRDFLEGEEKLIRETIQGAAQCTNPFDFERYKRKDEPEWHAHVDAVKEIYVAAGGQVKDAKL